MEVYASVAGILMLRLTRSYSHFGHWVALAMILVVATYLRVVGIETQGLWLDEGWTIVQSQWPFIDMLLMPTESSPVLYYLFHQLFLSADSPLWAVRSISVVAGVISVGLMYFFGRLALGAMGGLLAAALLAVWQPHVDYSQEARSYSVLFLLTLLTSVGLLYYSRLLASDTASSGNANSRQRNLALALFGIGNVLSFYTHITAIFWIVLTCLLMIAVVIRERRVHWTELVVTFGVMAFCALPGMYRLIQQKIVGDHFNWLRQATPAEFLVAVAKMFFPAGLWDGSTTDALGISDAARAASAIAFLVLMLTAMWFGRRKLFEYFNHRPIVLGLILAYLAVPVITWMVGYLARPIFMERVILFSLPGPILLITAICLAYETRIAHWAGIAAIVLYGASTLMLGTMREREDWRGAENYLTASVSPGDVIAICRLPNYLPLRYHATAPTGGAVVAMESDGALVKIEDGLGTDRDWNKTYFRNVVVPRLAARMAGGRLAPHDSGTAATLELRPGQSLWRIDGHCSLSLTLLMDAAVSDLVPDPGVAWTERSARSSACEAKSCNPRGLVIEIRHYRANEPSTLEVRSLSARQ